MVRRAADALTLTAPDKALEVLARFGVKPDVEPRRRHATGVAGVVELHGRLIDERLAA